MTKREKTKKYICYCLVLLAFDLLQNVAGLLPEIGSARCFALIPAVIILSMGEDELCAALLGLFAGLIWDAHSGVHLGFNFIFLAVMCFLAAASITYIVRDIFITDFIASAISSALYCLVYWLIFIIIKGVESAEMTLFSFYIPCFIYTVAATPIIWLIIRPIKKKFGYKEEITAE